MSNAEYSDEFLEAHRQRLKQMSNDELHAYFEELLDKLMQPLIEKARDHTSPSVERSVLLRMGLSSSTAETLVNRMVEKGLLGHGAGYLVWGLARQQGITVREASEALLRGEYWDILPV